jgi:glycosyltransferase involved in cell wall biosynthesis
MLPDSAHPERGRFVRDQVSALQRIAGLEVDLYEFPPGGRALVAAARELRRRSRAAGGAAPDIVHAHFGLTAWPSLALHARVRALTVHGTDVNHPRTRLATMAVLPAIDLLAAASADLVAQLPTGRARRRAEVLPCGVDLERFRPIPRARARVELGLEPDVPFLLFPADPARPAKRADRAFALAEAAGVRLLTLGGVDPDRVPLWVNAASAVVVPSEREGFGLAVLEALACDVPVLATPVGVHAEALDGVEGALCAPFEVSLWLAALRPHLHVADPRVQGRARAERFSAQTMAERVRDAWARALQRSAQHAG